MAVLRTEPWKILRGARLGTRLGTGSVGGPGLYIHRGESPKNRETRRIGFRESLPSRSTVNGCEAPAVHGRHGGGARIGCLNGGEVHRQWEHQALPPPAVGRQQHDSRASDDPAHRPGGRCDRNRSVPLRWASLPTSHRRPRGTPRRRRAQCANGSKRRARRFDPRPGRNDTPAVRRSGRLRGGGGASGAAARSGVAAAARRREAAPPVAAPAFSRAGVAGTCRLAGGRCSSGGAASRGSSRALPRRLAPLELGAGCSRQPNASDIGVPADARSARCRRRSGDSVCGRSDSARRLPSLVRVAGCTRRGAPRPRWQLRWPWLLRARASVRSGRGATTVQGQLRRSCARKRGEGRLTGGAVSEVLLAAVSWPPARERSIQAASVSASRHEPAAASEQKSEGILQQALNRLVAQGFAAHDVFLSRVERSGGASLARSSAGSTSARSMNRASSVTTSKHRATGRRLNRPRSAAHVPRPYEVLCVSARGFATLLPRARRAGGPSAQASTPGHNSSPGAIDRASRVFATASPSARLISVR